MSRRQSYRPNRLGQDTSTLLGSPFGGSPLGTTSGYHFGTPETLGEAGYRSSFSSGATFSGEQVAYLGAERTGEASAGPSKQGESALSSGGQEGGSSMTDAAAPSGLGPGSHFGDRPSGGSPGSHLGDRPSGGSPGSH